MNDGFPYQDWREADKASDAMVMERLETIRSEFSIRASFAWHDKDYRSHSIFSHASNKIAMMMRKLGEI